MITRSGSGIPRARRTYASLVEMRHPLSSAVGGCSEFQRRKGTCPIFGTAISSPPGVSDALASAMTQLAAGTERAQGAGEAGSAEAWAAPDSRAGNAI